MDSPFKSFSSHSNSQSFPGLVATAHPFGPSLSLDRDMLTQSPTDMMISELNARPFLDPVMFSIFSPDVQKAMRDVTQNASTVGRKRQRTHEDDARQSKKLKESGMKLADPMPRRRFAHTGINAPPRKSLASSLLKGLSLRRAVPVSASDCSGPAPASAGMTFQFIKFDFGRLVFPRSRNFARSSVAPQGLLVATSGTTEDISNLDPTIDSRLPMALCTGDESEKVKCPVVAPQAAAQTLCPALSSPENDAKVPGQYNLAAVSVMKYAEAQARIEDLATELAQEKANMKVMQRAYDELNQRYRQLQVCHVEHLGTPLGCRCPSESGRASSKKALSSFRSSTHFFKKLMTL